MTLRGAGLAVVLTSWGLFGCLDLDPDHYFDAGCARCSTGGGLATGGGLVVGGGAGTGGGGSTGGGIAVITTGAACSASGFCSENPMPSVRPWRALSGSTSSDVWLTGNDDVFMRFDGSTWNSVASRSGLATTPSVVAFSKTDAWACGAAGTLLHWNGSGWQSVVSGTSNNLEHLWGPASNDVWAVGDHGVALHFNGTTWAATATGSSSPLLAIHGASNAEVWAGTKGGLLHWSSGAWAAVPLANVTIDAIFMVSASDGWAGGADDSGQGVLYRYNGSSWAAMSAPFSGTVAALWGFASNDVWAVGKSGSALHWNGSAWSQTTTGTGRYLSAVWGKTSTDVWAAGDRGVLLHWSGSSWTVLTKDVSDKDLRAMSFTSPTEGWAAGAAGTLLKWNGAEWAAAISNTSVDLTALWSLAANDVWASGAGGLVLRWNGSVWMPQSPATSVRLASIHGTSATNVWAVGDMSTFHYTGAGWASVTNPVPAGTALLDVVALDATNALAVGTNGFAMKWNGSSWASISTGTSATLMKLFKASATDVWVVGFASGGEVLLRFTGAAFSPLTSLPGSSRGLQHVWGTSSTDVYVTGSSDNQVFHWNGANWSPVDFGQVGQVGVFGIAGASSTEVWSFGLGGAITHRRP